MPEDQFGEVEETEVGEPTGKPIPTTVEELLRYLLEFLPKDKWGNLITISGPISAQGLAQALLSPQGRLWFDSLTIEREATIDDLMRGNLAKLPFKLPRMRTGFETGIEEYAGRIKDKKFVEKFLASAGAGSIYDLPGWQQRQLADAIKRQYEGETGVAQARPPWAGGAPYAGFARYEDYTAQRQAEEQLLREQGADIDMYIAPKTAFGKGGMRPLLEAWGQEESLRNLFRRAKELGIDTSALEATQYQPGVTDPLETGAHIGLALQIQQEEQRRGLARSQQLAADFPEFAGQYRAFMAPTEQEIYRPEPLAGMEAWLKTLPEFKEAQTKRRTEMFEKYPRAWGAYEAYQGPMGWEEWTAQEPTAQAYIKAQELKFTQTRQRARARIAPRRARWQV